MNPSYVTIRQPSPIPSEQRALIGRFQAMGIKTTILSDHTHSYWDHLNYLTVHDSGMYIINNKNAPLSPEITHEIVYAMRNKKTIIMLAPPDFKPSVDLLHRHIIVSRLSKLLLCDISMLDESDLKELLRNLHGDKTDYQLTKNESIITAARLRQLFNSLPATSVD